jgi:hypothetical protein
MSKLRNSQMSGQLWVIVENKTKRNCPDHFKTQTQHLHGGTEEIHERTASHVSQSL